MKTRSEKLACISLLMFVLCVGHSNANFEYDSLPSIPIQTNDGSFNGFSGLYAGFSNNALVLAGGSLCSGSDIYPDLQKQYLDDIYVLPLDSPDQWLILSQKLSQTLAFGAAVSVDQGVLVIGGQNEHGCSSRVFLLRWDPAAEKIDILPYPSLPVPLTRFAATRIDDRVYVLGGSRSATEYDSTRHFYVIDLQQQNSGDLRWTSLPPWPGDSRVDPVAVAQSNGVNDCIFLFSGKKSPSPAETVLYHDGYVYNPVLNTWQKLNIQNLSFSVAGGSAFAAGTNSIVFAGTIDSKLEIIKAELLNKLWQPNSEQAETSGDPHESLPSTTSAFFTQHPGHRQDVFVYNTVTSSLAIFDRLPFPFQKYAGSVNMDNKCFLIGGKVKPGECTLACNVITVSDQRKSFGLVNSLVLLIYLVVLVWIGWVFAKRQKSTDDFFKGGGRVPWWAAGLSIFGTVLSAITFMAIPAKTYATDWSYFMFNMGIIMVAPFVILWFIPFYRKMNITTAYEFLEIRFNLATRLLGSLSFILFQIGRMGIVLFLPSIALSVVTGIPIIACILVMGLFSMIYTSIGGIEAVIWTDVIQVIVLLGGALLSLAIIALNVQGGLPGMIEVGIEQDKFNIFNTAFDLKQPFLWTVLIASLFTNLTTYGTDQTIVQRYLTVKDQRAASNSVWTNAILSVPASLLFFMMGTALFVFYRQHPTETSLAIQEADAIFPWYIMTQLPRGVSGLLIAGIFAAAMSSLSSSINSAATAFITDFHQRFGWGRQKDSLRAAKLASVIIGIVGTLFAVFMASWDIKSLWDEFNKILGLVLGGLGGVFLLGVLSKRASGIAALGGIMISALVQYLVALYQPVHLLMYTATGVIACFVSGQFISLFFPNKKPHNSKDQT